MMCKIVKYEEDVDNYEVPDYQFDEIESDEESQEKRDWFSTEE
ncbi:hypothetical protein AB6880_03520 [Rahnella inusitata]